MTKKAEQISKALHDLAGRKISRVQIGVSRYTEVQGKIPTARFLANFDVLVKKGTGGAFSFLVLDPYGACDSGMAQDLLRHTNAHECDIAVDRDTGAVHCCTFCRQGNVVHMDLHGKTWQVPPEYRARLDELRNKKRPYGFLIDSPTLHSVATGYYGHERLADALVLALDFDDVTVELAQDGEYRTTTPWKQV